MEEHGQTDIQDRVMIAINLGDLYSAPFWLESPLTRLHVWKHWASLSRTIALCPRLKLGLWMVAIRKRVTDSDAW